MKKFAISLVEAAYRVQLTEKALSTNCILKKKAWEIYYTEKKEVSFYGNDVNLFYVKM